MLYDRFIRPSPSSAICCPEFEHPESVENFDIFNNEHVESLRLQTYRQLLHTTFFPSITRPWKTAHVAPTTYPEKWPCFPQFSQECKISHQHCHFFSGQRTLPFNHNSFIDWISESKLIICEYPISLYTLDIEKDNQIQVIYKFSSHISTTFVYKKLNKIFVALRQGHLYSFSLDFKEMHKIDDMVCHLFEQFNTFKPCWTSAICGDEHGEFLVTGNSCGTIFVRDASTISVTFHKIVAHYGAIRSIKVSPSNEFIVSTSGKQNLKVWSFKTMSKYMSIGCSIESDMEKLHDFHPLQSAMLAYVDKIENHNTYVIVMKLNSKKIIGKIPLHSNYIIESLSWCPLSGELVLILWQDTSTIGELLHDVLRKAVVYSDFNKIVRTADLRFSRHAQSWSPNGSQFITTDPDGTITVWSFFTLIDKQRELEVIEKLIKKSAEKRKENVPYFVYNYLNILHRSHL